MKRIAVLFVCLSASLALADPRGRYMFGIGRSSCATWMSSAQRQSEGEAWLYGFWSGLNTFNSQDSAVGSETDANGIVAEVKKVCSASPSKSLSDAVEAVYFSMAKGKYAPSPK